MKKFCRIKCISLNLNGIMLKLLLIIWTGKLILCIFFRWIQGNSLIFIDSLIFFSNSPKRVLGFRKAIPATGRKVNLITEILRYADPNLQQSFFISPQPDQNVCFTGDCAQYCDEYHPICGQKDTIEVCYQSKFLLKFSIFWELSTFFRNSGLIRNIHTATRRNWANRK